MLDTLFVTTSLLICQQMYHFDDTIVRFDDTPQWVVGNTELCPPADVLSPDWGPRIRAAKLEQRLAELRKPAFVAGRSEAMNCRPRADARRFQVDFGSGADLDQKGHAQLVALAAESPVVIELSTTAGGVSYEVARARLTAIRTNLARLMTSSVSVKEHIRASEDVKTDAGYVEIVAMVLLPCDQGAGQGQTVKTRVPEGGG